MAGTQKHKTKYKKPADLDKSQSKSFLKKQIRKDIKDYIVDKYEGYNPNSVEEKQQNVLRKTDKQVIDDVENMVPNKKDVADYYKVNGEHDPKYTAKERAKLQDEDEKSSKEEIKDKIENLTREGKEILVREYIRRKIKKVLSENAGLKNLLEAEEDEVAATETPEDAGIDPTVPIEDPTTDPAATDMATDPVATATPATPAATDMATDPAATDMATDPAATGAPTTPATPPATPPAAPTAAAPEPVVKSPEDQTAEHINNEVGVTNKTAFLSKAFHMAYKDADPGDTETAMKLLIRSLYKTQRLNQNKS